MPVSATPDYLGTDFRSASPALRFGMYLSVWTSREDQEREFKDRQQRKSGEAHDLRDSVKSEGFDAALQREVADGRIPQLWMKNESGGGPAWQNAAVLTPDDASCAKAFHDRQSAALRAMPNTRVLELAAQSVAPFSTGLGIEHPLENGFAFLSPYGLPYLPGTGVKGVLRRAAEELTHREMFGNDSAWTLPLIWHLFGFEPWPRPRKNQDVSDWATRLKGFPLDRPTVQTYLDAIFGNADSEVRERILSADDPCLALLQQRHLHVRGALAFWDVVPQMPLNKGLDVEVMTPHYSHYYQKRKHDGEGSVTPHDSGKPNPINFLVVPPGSSFVFRVSCDVGRLWRVAPELAKDAAWKTPLQQAFFHAYEWLGFGAKTAVGYGAMRADPREAERERAVQAQQEAVLAQEKKERKRKEAGEAARRQQAVERARVEALSPAQRYTEKADRALDRFDAGGHMEKNDARRELLRLANASEDESRAWSAEDRQITADVVERIYETIGWHEPSAKTNQRKKQQLKRRNLVERLRSAE